MGGIDLRLRNSRFRIALLLAVLATGSGLYSLSLGADHDWDMLNYHLYNPFALLNDRSAYDIEPAQGQTFLNPLIDVPFYMLIRHLNDFPRLIGFIQGAVDGINLLAIGWLAWHLLGRSTDGAPRLRGVLSVTAIVIGGTGADSSGLIGSATGDIPVGALVMMAVMFAVRAIDAAPARARTLRNVMMSGLLAGVAFGLKPTAGPFGVGLALALATLRRPFLIEGEALFIAAASCGCLLSAGYHAMTMYRLFSNPVFPAFNEFFHSPYYIGSLEVLDIRHRFSLSDALSFPFQSVWLQGVPSGGYVFRDVRLALAIVLGLTVVGAWLWTRAARRVGPRPVRSLIAVIAFFLVSLSLSLAVFNNYRYLVPIEDVSGAVIVAALAHLLARRAWVVGILALAAAAACLLTTRPLSLPRDRWTNRYVSVDGPDLAPDTLVVVAFWPGPAGQEPIGYLAPFFDPAVRWVRTRSNVYRVFGSPDRLTLTAKRLVAAHEGPMVSLELPQAAATGDNPVLQDLSVERTGAPCRPVTSNLTSSVYVMCPIRNRSG